MSAKALLIGYYGYMNTGDDVFACVCWRELSSRFGIGRFDLWGPRVPAPMAGCVKPLLAPNRVLWRGPFRRIPALACALGVQRVVFGGGSNLHTADVIDDFRRIIRWAGRGPHFAAGISVGPFRNGSAERACARLLKTLAFIGVRDRSSLERAQSLAPRVRAELTFDIAVQFGQPRTRRSTATQRKSLGVALCNYERFVEGSVAEEERRVRTVAESIRQLAAGGLVTDVVLMDFCGHPFLGDQSVHNTLRELLGDAVDVRHVPYSDDPAIVFEEVAGVDALLAMRLHAAVFGYRLNTPVVQLLYHEKCSQWSEMIGQDPRQTLPSQGLSASSLVGALALALSSSPGAPALPVQRALERAEANWTWSRGV